jgi:hypothetical protein
LAAKPSATPPLEYSRAPDANSSPGVNTLSIDDALEAEKRVLLEVDVDAEVEVDETDCVAARRELGVSRTTGEVRARG